MIGLQFFTVFWADLEGAGSLLSSNIKEPHPIKVNKVRIYDDQNFSGAKSHLVLVGILEEKYHRYFPLC